MARSELFIPVDLNLIEFPRPKEKVIIKPRETSLLLDDRTLVDAWLEFTRVHLLITSDSSIVSMRGQGSRLIESKSHGRIRTLRSRLNKLNPSVLIGSFRLTLYSVHRDINTINLDIDCANAFSPIEIQKDENYPQFIADFVRGDFNRSYLRKIPTFKGIIMCYDRPKWDTSRTTTNWQPQANGK